MTSLSCFCSEGSTIYTTVFTGVEIAYQNYFKARKCILFLTGVFFQSSLNNLTKIKFILKCYRTCKYTPVFSPPPWYEPL